MTRLTTCNIRHLLTYRLSALQLPLTLCLLFLLVAISLVPVLVISKKTKVSSVLPLLSIVVLSPKLALGRVQEPILQKKVSRSLRSILKPAPVQRRTPIPANTCLVRDCSTLADLFPHLGL